jgi:hypothetical protein
MREIDEIDIAMADEEKVTERYVRLHLNFMLFQGTWPFGADRIADQRGRAHDNLSRGIRDSGT